MKTSDPIHGLMACFADPAQVVAAARLAHAEGYRCMDAYTPFPIDGLAESLGHRRSPVALLVLLGGICGGSGGYLMQYYAMAVGFPLNIGGRPFHSWPSFIPITFELTVLFGSLTALISMLLLNGLPEPYHPAFNVPEFSRASTDRFFLCIEARDPRFDPVLTRRFLDRLCPESVFVVPL
jgi:hypothetical protein